MNNFIKFLLTLFFFALLGYTINSFAWTKLQVTNGERSWGGEYETLEAAQAQYESVKNNIILKPHTCAYGLVDRWIRLEGSEPTQGYTETREVVIQEAMAEQVIMQMQYDEEGNELGEIEVTLPAIAEEKVTEYFYPQEFSVEYQDITAQKQAEALQEAIRVNRAKGQSAINYVIALNLQRGLSAENRKLFMANASVREAWDNFEVGNIPAAIVAIQAAEVDGVIITTEIKNAILEYLNGL
jgi:hypothetical protein